MDLAGNIAAVEKRIRSACDRAERDRDSVALLAVAKGQPPHLIRAAADLGLMLFGENRIQEAKIKIGQCPGRLRWHMIGHLQSNKCREAVRLFEMIQSVDSLALAREIQKHADKEARTIQVLLETNVAGESTKFGFTPERLLADLIEVNALHRIEIHGLMTIAPWTQEPERVRPILRQLRVLKESCEQILGAPLPHLSMGMTSDFEVAIEEGATIIRLGTALFGERSKPIDGKGQTI
jgi:PLP dependent protein